MNDIMENGGTPQIAAFKYSYMLMTLWDFAKWGDEPRIGVVSVTPYSEKVLVVTREFVEWKRIPNLERLDHFGQSSCRFHSDDNR